MARQAHDELVAGGGSFLVEPVGDLDWAAYVERLRAVEDGAGAGVFRVAVVGDELVGRVAITADADPVARRGRRPHRLWLRRYLVPAG